MLSRLHHRSLYAALAVYLLLSPLAIYNTLALFGLVQSRLVWLQLCITACMIVLSFIASRPISRHCLDNAKKRDKILWFASFYVIGPPMLFIYYHIKFKPMHAAKLSPAAERLG